MVTSQEQATGQDLGKLAEVLQGWHRAREASSRHNRNLMQYGTMVAGALGIETGSGGVICIASVLGTLPWWGPVLLLVTTVITVVIAAVGIALGLRAYRLRSVAEQAAERYSIQLIALRPDHFLPDSDGLLDSQP